MIYLPNILIIDLKRWGHHTNNKLNTLIRTPIHNADFSKYVKGYNPKTYMYDLYGVCNHGGSVHGGHYTSFVKNANEQWYHYNDTSVSKVSLLSQIVSPKAYCFFYRKRLIIK